MLTLPVLTPAEITDLLANPRKRKINKSKPYGISFDSNNRISITQNPTAAQKGGYRGKVGSVTRTRKGRTVRQPNGFVFYDGLDQLPAYKV